MENFTSISTFPTLEIKRHPHPKGDGIFQVIATHEGKSFPMREHKGLNYSFRGYEKTQQVFDQIQYLFDYVKGASLNDGDLITIRMDEQGCGNVSHELLHDVQMEEEEPLTKAEIAALEAEAKEEDKYIRDFQIEGN